VVSRELTRSRLTVAALALVEVVVVAVAATAYGTDGLSATVAALVLAPVAVVAVFRIGLLLAGELFAVAAAAAYVALPALASTFMLSTYRSTFTHEALPDLLGLRATPYFAAGVAIACVAGLRPILVAAAGLVILAIAVGIDGLGGFGAIRDGLHETAWSITMLVWIGAAGVVGAARRSPLIALGLGGWLGAVVVHGADRGYDNAAFWQALAAGAPAAAVIVTALALLVPRLRAFPARAH
jgi:hypothetical protein